MYNANYQRCFLWTLILSIAPAVQLHVYFMLYAHLFILHWCTIMHTYLVKWSVPCLCNSTKQAERITAYLAHKVAPFIFLYFHHYLHSLLIMLHYCIMLSQYEHPIAHWCCKTLVCDKMQQGYTWLNLNPCTHATCARAWDVFLWPFFFFGLTSCVMPYPILYVLSLPAFALSHSLPSKCWHISFKWSVFISHSLFPSSLPPLLILWGEAECVLQGSFPRQPHHCFSSSYLFFPPLLSFSSICLVRLLLSAVGCQRASTRDFIPQAALWLSVADFWFQWTLFIARMPFLHLKNFVWFYLITMMFVALLHLNNSVFLLTHLEYSLCSHCHPAFRTAIFTGHLNVYIKVNCECICAWQRIAKGERESQNNMLGSL